MKISDLSSKFYLGFDESNHGKFPEIFTLTYSKNSDLVLYEKSIGKKRHHKHGFPGEILNQGIDYSFLLLSEENFERIPKLKLPGVIVASLIKDIPKNELNIFIDGKLSSQQESFMEKIITKCFSLDSRNLKINSGDQYDEHYKIVNVADELAHYLFRVCTLEDISKNPHKGVLLIDLAA